MTTRTLKDLTPRDCLRAFYLNHCIGEGGWYIAGDLKCHINTTSAAIVRGEKLAKEIFNGPLFALTAADQRVADIKAGRITEGPALLAARLPKIG